MSDSPARRPLGSGDEWVHGPDGQKFWGKYGSAGLLTHHPERGVLLQLRASWSHFGDTWGLPGGARHEDESAVQAALREAHEEAGVLESHLRLEFESRLDLGYWSYTTVVAEAIQFFEPVIGDAESAALRWVHRSEVAELPLHPGLAASWPSLRTELGQRVVVVVDSANVIGSRPNGWWKDRRAATQSFAENLGRLAVGGVPAIQLGLERDTRWTQIVLVVEGEAAHIDHPSAGNGLNNTLEVVRATADGDQAIVDAVAVQSDTDGVKAPAIVFVVTADRQLAGRVTELGARVLRPSWLWRLVDAG